MPSKLYKILRVQIGETEGANQKRFKQTLDVGRVIKHDSNGNEWLSVQIDAAHLGPVLYQLCKPYHADRGLMIFQGPGGNCQGILDSSGRGPRS
jgi:hypothetical protein